MDHKCKMLKGKILSAVDDFRRLQKNIPFYCLTNFKSWNKAFRKWSIKACQFLESFPIFEAAVNEWNKTIKGSEFRCKKIIPAPLSPVMSRARLEVSFLLCLDVSVKLIWLYLFSFSETEWITSNLVQLERSIRRWILAKVSKR